MDYESLAITIIGFGSLMFVLSFLVCITIYRYMKFSDNVCSTRSKVRSIYDSIIILRKVLKQECCINITAGELFDELDDKIFELYKEYH